MISIVLRSATVDRPAPQHDACWQKKRKDNREKALAKLTELYIDALYYFEMAGQRAKSPSKVSFLI